MHFHTILGFPHILQKNKITDICENPVMENRERKLCKVCKFVRIFNQAKVNLTHKDKMINIFNLFFFINEEVNS